MNLFEKISTIYPELTVDDFHPVTGTIRLVNEGSGDYVASWSHPTLTEPTQQELDAVTGDYVPSTQVNEKIYDEVLATQKILKLLIETLNAGTFIPGSNYTAAQIKNFIVNKM